MDFFNETETNNTSNVPQYDMTYHTGDNNNNEPSEFIPLGGNQGDNNMQFGMSEEEETRIAARKAEEVERRRKIEEKINYELQAKEELRSKAAEFINNNELKYNEAIQIRKKQNSDNEEALKADRQLMLEGKKNPWEKVLDNITIKESDYKGSKNVQRMRAVILSRKGDYAKK